MDDDQEVVGSTNDSQVSRRNQIADGVDSARSDELEDVVYDGQQAFALEEAEEEEEPKPVRKFKIKVNGRDMELTEAEMIERVQKVESADQYLRDAAAKKREADESVTRAPPSADVEPTADDLVLVRALQMGSEEEAAQAIAKIRKATPSFNQDELVAKALDTLRFQQDAQWFQEEYPDIFSNDDLRDVAVMMDEKAVERGDRRPYRERYADIGGRVRAMVGKGKDSLEAKRQAKAASAAPIKQASGRNAPVQDEEDDDTPSAVINKMAKGRGQLNV